MALLATLDLTADGRVSVKAKNHRTGQPNRYSFIAYGDFGSGTITLQVSADGSTWVSNVVSGSTFTFTDDTADNIEINSDPLVPVYIGFSLAGATDPDIIIKVYDNK